MSGTVAIGSDHAGFLLKEALEDELVSGGYTVVDFGTDSEESCDYPDFGLAVAEAVSTGEAWRGVLVCGTGAGMAMVANKVPGVRAAACNEPYTAEYCRLHNDANVLTMGARIVDPQAAKRILHAFLDAEYEGEASRHERRLGKIRDVERKYMKEA
ncbi:MAG: ribose 5-phosphate isomerase B [Actinobacteria bacterium]|nr:ribose 5-phosphate isomerase B [Actinomycetota bacterium]MBU1944962.1 ribose 5-phosphate isomerase B [Actinomycetota bacterium]MBU2688444.1 ribose 5-phosphate isomerase B [Actinomycetota bacterium]